MWVEGWLHWNQDHLYRTMRIITMPQSASYHGSCKSWAFPIKVTQIYPQGWDRVLGSFSDTMRVRLIICSATYVPSQRGFSIGLPWTELGPAECFTVCALLRDACGRIWVPPMTSSGPPRLESASVLVWPNSQKCRPYLWSGSELLWGGTQPLARMTGIAPRNPPLDHGTCLWDTGLLDCRV